MMNQELVGSTIHTFRILVDLATSLTQDRREPCRATREFMPKFALPRDVLMKGSRSDCLAFIEALRTVRERYSFFSSMPMS
jgi:hypothetical protein